MNYQSFAAAFVAFTLCGFVNAQESAEDPNDVPEEITVYGQKTLLNMRFAVERAETDFFDRFNELNDDDQYDVFCDEIAKTGSRIRRRTCWSPFEREIDEEETKYAFETGGRVGMRNEGLIRLKREKQAELLKNMVIENPELQKLYTDYGNANIRFLTERQRRCADNILCLEPKEKKADK